MRPYRLLLLTALLMLVPTGTARAKYKSKLKHGVAFHVREESGMGRQAEPVTFAFPIAKKEKIKRVDQLEVLAPSGNPVAVQMRVQERWRGAPQDETRFIRWVLIDMQVDIPAATTLEYTVRKKRSDAEQPPAPPPLNLAEDAQALHVDTGTGQFRISKQTANFLDFLAADLDGDGSIEEGEELIDSPTGAGFVLTDRFGAAYSSTMSPVTVQVEEQGPLRTIIRCDGLHEPVDPEVGTGRDFFQYRTRYTFYAGKPYMKVQHTLRNAYLDNPLGSIGFGSYSLVTSLAAPAIGGPPTSASYGVDGDVLFTTAGDSTLYQDSHGGETWADTAGTTFRGFEVTDQAESLLTAGNQANGTCHLRSGNAGVTFHMLDFFENFPKGYAFDGLAGMRFDIFPDAFAGAYWLDDGQQKTTEFYVVGHGANGPGVGPVTRGFEYIMHPWPDSDWLRQTRAWGDQGYLDKPAVSDAAIIAYDEGELWGLYDSAFQNDSFSFGWSEFGELTWARNTHTTGSPRNRLTYFGRHILTGSFADFRINELFTLHSRDIRTYHIDGFSKEVKPNATLWEALPPWSHSADKLGRDSLDPALDPHRAGIPPGGHGWNAFDMEHFVADDLYEHYLLTGDLVTLDSLEEMGECVRTWPIYSLTKAPGSSRGTGWTMRALLKMWRVTGNQDFLDAADDLVASVRATYGTKKSPITRKVYHYITRYPPHNGHISDADYDLPWQLAVVIHGMLMHHAETGSKHSKRIALDVTSYITQYGWNGSTIHEALAVDDHNNINPKGNNTGINTWIPSALAMAYKVKPKKKWFKIARSMYNSVPAFHSPVNYLGYATWHWWHPYQAILRSEQK